AALGRPRVGYGSYQSFGDLALTLPASHADHSDYRRSLDLGMAVATVEYTVGEVRHVRSHFVSHPDRVIVVHLSASRPGQVAFGLKIVLPANRSGSVTAVDGLVTVGGALTDNGLAFEGQIRVLADGGTLVDEA